MDQNLEALYDSQIAPLMAQIVTICTKNQMPMVAIFQYKDSRLCGSIVSPDSFDNKIIDDDGLFRHQTVKFISGVVKKTQKTRNIDKS